MPKCVGRAGVVGVCFSGFNLRFAFRRQIHGSRTSGKISWGAWATKLPSSVKTADITERLKGGATLVICLLGAVVVKDYTAQDPRLYITRRLC